MEITKEVLQDRIAGMMQQLSIALEQTAQLQGAINACRMLIEYLDAPEPEDPAPVDPAPIEEHEED